MMDFMVLQCICVALVMIYPDIAMWFPKWLKEHHDMRAEPARTAPLRVAARP
jgi:hypothetical protein